MLAKLSRHDGSQLVNDILHHLEPMLCAYSGVTSQDHLMFKQSHKGVATMVANTGNGGSLGVAPYQLVHCAGAITSADQLGPARRGIHPAFVGTGESNKDSSLFLVKGGERVGGGRRRREGGLWDGWWFERLRNLGAMEFRLRMMQKPGAM
jgi:hypothetical protein